MSISLSSEYSGLISLRIDWFDLLAVPGALKKLNTGLIMLRRSGLALQEPLEGHEYFFLFPSET